MGDEDKNRDLRSRGLLALHVIPRHDIKEHEETRLCWCRPELASFEDGEEVWAHNAFADQYFKDKTIN